LLPVDRGGNAQPIEQPPQTLFVEGERFGQLIRSVFENALATLVGLRVDLFGLSLDLPRQKRAVSPPRNRSSTA
jgi:hypothetical protein